MKIKFLCDSCEKRILVPSKGIGRSHKCPGCKHELTIPKGYTRQVVLLICNCGEEHPSGTAVCQACGMDMWTFLAQAARGKQGEDDGDGGKQWPGPIPIPEGRSLAPEMRVKFPCECGQRLRTPVKKLDQPAECPRCKEEIVAPAPDDRVRVIEVSCGCGEVAAPDASSCANCGDRYFDGDEPDGAPAPAAAATAPPAPRQKQLADTVRVKWKCECGQKVRIPIKKLHKVVECPKCDATLQAPDPQTSAALDVSCECGKAVSFSAPECAGCGETVWAYPPEPEPDTTDAEEAAPGEAPPVAAAAAAPAPAAEDKQAGSKRLSQRRSMRRKGGKKPIMAAQVLVTLLILVLSTFLWYHVLTASDDKAEAAKSNRPKVMPDVEEYTPTDRPKTGEQIARREDPPTRETTPDPPPKEEKETTEDEVKEALNEAMGSKEPDPGTERKPPSREDVKTGVEQALGTDVPPYTVMMRTQGIPMPPRKIRPPKIAAAKGEPDYEFFKKQVMPIFKAACMNCHGNEFLPVGQLKFKDKSSFAKKNFQATLKFIDSGDPANSKLVRAPLAVTDGGVDHGGGQILRKSNKEYKVLLDFVRGERLGKPTADAGKDQIGFTGAALKLDGAASADPKSSSLKYQWEVRFRPKGSTAKILSADKKVASFKPDRPGVYVIELLVTNRLKTPSDPDSLTIDVRLPAAAVIGTKPTGAALADRQRVVMKMFGALLGREPTAAEIDRSVATPIPRLVGELFQMGATWRRWYDAELAHLRLVGQFAPTTPRMKTLDIQLANHEVSAIDALRAIVSSDAFTRRFPGHADQVTVLFKQYLGIDLGRKENEQLKLAALAAASGKGGQLYGNTAYSVPEIMGIFLRQDQFGSLFIQRHYRKLTGKSPPADQLKRWTGLLKGDGYAFETFVTEWINSKVF